MINPGTVAAIAASLMGNSETLDRQSGLWEGLPENGTRQQWIEDYVGLAWDIAEETERQHAEKQSVKE